MKNKTFRLTSISRILLNILLLSLATFSTSWAEPPPPGLLDKCRAYPWYLAFQTDQSDKMVEFAQKRLSEFIRLWKIDKGPILISASGNPGLLSDKRILYVIHSLEASGISKDNIWTGNAKKNPDQSFLNVIEISFPDEGMTCRKQQREKQIQWLLKNCVNEHNKLCEYQIKNIER